MRNSYYERALKHQRKQHRKPTGSYTIVEVSITDAGYGIPAEIRQKIFDPFFSTKIGKKNTGSGLSICQHIIESHQGIITCASGDHTTFNIRLLLAGAYE